MSISTASCTMPTTPASDAPLPTFKRVMPYISLICGVYLIGAGVWSCLSRMDIEGAEFGVMVGVLLSLPVFGFFFAENVRTIARRWRL